MKDLPENHVFTGQVLAHMNIFLLIVIIVKTIWLLNMFNIIFRGGRRALPFLGYLLTRCPSTVPEYDSNVNTAPFSEYSHQNSGAVPVPGSMVSTLLIWQ